MTTKVNGVRVHFGPREVESAAPSTTEDSIIRELIVPITFDNLPTTDATDAVILAIPANAYVKSAVLLVDKAFTSTSGTTTLDVGISKLDGTVVDANGIIAAAVVDSTVAGTPVIGAGAVVGAGVGAAAVQVTAAPSVNDLTAGAGRLVIQYIV